MSSFGHAEHRSPNSVCYELTKKQDMYATAGRAITRCQLLGVGAKNLRKKPTRKSSVLSPSHSSATTTLRRAPPGLGMAACHHQTTPNPECHALETRCTVRPPWRRRPQPQFGGRNRLRPQSVAAHTYIHQTVAATNCGRSVCDSALILALVPPIRSAPPRPVPRMACRPALTKSSCEQKTPTT